MRRSVVQIARQAAASAAPARRAGFASISVATRTRAATVSSTRPANLSFSSRREQNCSVYNHSGSILTDPGLGFVLGFASTDSAAPSVEDPTEHTAMEAMQEGNKHLEEGDIQGARDQYSKSVEIKPTASGCFNLGVGAVVGHRAGKRRFELTPNGPLL